ncbi:MAG: zinc ribbon domain-containing protein [Deltaproteobacteria bacterium]|nr:zinc ribbon domain-containing protein [Deltaproteobacteria bacterium]
MMRPMRQIICMFCVAVLSCGVVAGEAAKELELLKVTKASDAKQIPGFFPTSACNATVNIDTDKAETWLSIDFTKPVKDAKQLFSAVLFEFDYTRAAMPFNWREAPDGTKEWPNVWTGYDAFVFDYENPEKTPVKIKVLLQDYVSWYHTDIDGLVRSKYVGAQQKYLPQMYQKDVELNPGKGRVHINLRNPMWTTQTPAEDKSAEEEMVPYGQSKLSRSSQKKGVELLDMWAFGLCNPSPEKELTVKVNHFRLEASDKNAGVITWPERATCPKCGRKISDRYAPFCPFCGVEMKDHLYPELLKKTMPVASDHTIIIPTIAAAGGASSNGGSKAMISKGDDNLRVFHYDINYNKPKGPQVQKLKDIWEGRYYLKFDLDKKINDQSKVKNATLWIFGSPPRVPDGQENQPQWAWMNPKNGKPICFSEKIWLPGLLVFAVDKEYNDWDPKMNWVTMPPLGKLIYMSGQYPGHHTQLHWRKDLIAPTLGKEATRWLCMDITDYIKEIAAEDQKTITLGLKGFTPFGASTHPHDLGHYLSGSGLVRDKELHPKIVVELESSEKGKS